MTASDAPARISADGKAVSFFLHVRPGAKHARIDGIVTEADGRRRLKVAVTALPEGGKANAAVVAFIARAAGVAKSKVEITAGRAARFKTVLIKGDPATILARVLPPDTTQQAQQRGE